VKVAGSKLRRVSPLKEEKSSSRLRALDC